jgi:hypothetical protein
MLYTVVPLERIYSNRTESMLANSKEEEQSANKKEAEYRDISLKHGSVRARRDGEDFVVDGMVSTDPSDYLNEEYVPGSTIK